MKKVLPFLVAALLVPGAALAKGPQNGAHPNQSGKKKNVMYVLKGLLCNYQAYGSVAAGQDGSISMLVQHSNRHGKLLKSTDTTCEAAMADNTLVTVAVGQNTKILLKNGVTTPLENDRVAVLVRSTRYAFKSHKNGAQVEDALTIRNDLSTAEAHMFRDWGPAS